MILLASFTQYPVPIGAVAHIFAFLARVMENSYRQRENLRRQGQANNQGGGKGGGEGGATPLGVLGGGVAAL